MNIDTELLLELDGHVYIVEKRDGVEVNRSEIEGKTVLTALQYVLAQGLDMMGQVASRIKIEEK